MGDEVKPQGTLKFTRKVSYVDSIQQSQTTLVSTKLAYPYWAILAEAVHHDQSQLL